MAGRDAGLVVGGLVALCLAVSTMAAPASNETSGDNTDSSQNITGIVVKRQLAVTYVCPGPNGRFADSTDCSRYYDCVNQVATRRSCGRGLLFDPNNQVCTADHQPEGCHMPDANPPPPPTLGTYQCPDSHGQYHDTSDCSQYYVCNHWNAVRRQCPSPQLYDPVHEICSDTVEPAGCHTLEATSGIDVFNCPRPNGQFQDSSDCSKYYNCVNNVFTNRACPAGQLFDNTVGQCRNTNTWPSGCNMPASWGVGGGGAGFTCPNPYGFYQDTNDCSRFWVCGANNQATLYQCAANELFIPRISDCSRDINIVAGCTMPRTFDAGFSCPTPYGNYQDTNDCSKYWSCNANNVATNRQCAANELFDPNRFECNSAIDRVDGCTMPSEFGGFTCRAAGTIHQDPSNCAFFWSCDANMVATRVECALNKLFDPQSGTCSSVHSSVSGCSLPTNWVQGSVGGFRCAHYTGNYQDVNDCSKYWTCNSNLIPTSNQCQFNQLFDPITFQCSNSVTNPNNCIMPPGRGGFNCVNTFGNYQDTSDCSKYWTCDTRRQATSNTCPSNQLFDPRIGRCNTVTRVDGCTMTTAISVGFVCTNTFGLYQDTSDCTKYWSCNTNRQAFSNNCPQGQLFDPSSSGCRAINFVQGCTIPPSFRPIVSQPVNPPAAVGQAPVCEYSNMASTVAHPRYCNAFYMCGEGILYHPCIFCGEGTYFDQGVGVCVSDNAVDFVNICPGKTMMPHDQKTAAIANGLC